MSGYIESAHAAMTSAVNEIPFGQVADALSQLEYFRNALEQVGGEIAPTLQNQSLPITESLEQIRTALMQLQQETEEKRDTLGVGGI